MYNEGDGCSCLLLSSLLYLSLCTAKVREFRIGTWRWLGLCPIQMPLLVDKRLFVSTKTSGASELTNGAEVLVEAILDLIGRGGWRLLLWWSETIYRFWEWALLSRFHVRAAQTASHQTILVVVAGAGSRSLTVEVHIKMTKFFTHSIRCGTCCLTKGVFIFAIVTLGSWQILVLLLQNFIDM